MRLYAARGLLGFIVALTMLALCGACTTPDAYYPRQDRSARQVTYRQVVPPTTDVYVRPMP